MNNEGSMKQIRSAICLIAIACLGSFASAQTPTGTIQGVVTDKTGAAIQGASITIIRTTTNENARRPADSAGRFTSFICRARRLQRHRRSQRLQSPPNRQRSGAGHRNPSGEFQARSRRSHRRPLRSTPQDQQTLDTETSSLGETIQTETILQLPDQGRNPFDFAFLVAGVNNVGNASTPHIGGSRNGNNEQLIDGMTNITPENNIGNNISTYTPVEDSVQEMNVQTNVLPAEYGRFSGGTESLITKSGGNRGTAPTSSSSRTPRSTRIHLRALGSTEPQLVPRTSTSRAALSAARSSRTGRSSSSTTSTRPGVGHLRQRQGSRPHPTSNGDFTSLFGATTPGALRSRHGGEECSGSLCPSAVQVTAANTTSFLSVASRLWRRRR